MAEAQRSNRPTPRTAAAAEAELRRRISKELEQARSGSDGQLDDSALAMIIAHAVASALQWHLDAPEHTRNATLSSRTWRPAGGPRGMPPRERDFDEGPREREYDRPPRRDFQGPPRERDFDRPPRRDFEGPPRERDFDRPPRQGGRPSGRPPFGGGGFKRGGGGSNKRRPPRSR
jgi:hypothetical protein